MSDTLCYASYLTLKTSLLATQYFFQNYWVGEDASLSGSTFTFMPFAFLGMTVTKSGDNQPATLAFPNNDLSRGWAETAVRGQWVADVKTVLIPDPDSKSNLTVLNQYVGQIVSASWDSTVLRLEMASVLDAVGADVPRKRLTKQLVGSLPLTSRVRVQ